MEKEKIDRINLLARESKIRELTSEERDEQNRLREEYLREFRAQFTDILDRTKIKRPDGTLEELKKKY